MWCVRVCDIGIFFGGRPSHTAGQYRHHQSIYSGVSNLWYLLHTHTHTHTWCVMYTHVKHRNPDCICFLGDVFDKFEKIHYTALTAFTEMISALAPYVPQIIVIPGNHDFPTNNQFLQPGRTTLSPFSLHPKVQLVEVPTPVLQQKPTL